MGAELIAGLVLVAAQAAATVPVPVHTLRLDEVQGADAMALADRVLSPAVRRVVVGGVIRRQWASGQVFALFYRTAGAPASADMCARTIRTIRAGAPMASGGKAPGDTVLTVAEGEVFEERAVLPPSERATPARCAVAQGYVRLDDDPLRSAAYRTLATAMAAAKARGRLRFALSCTDEGGQACSDPRQALATLPMDMLYGFTMHAREQTVLSERGGVRVVQDKRIAAGDAYQIEVSFGMSGDDGKSWRVYWDQTPAGVAAIRLARHAVVYH